MQGVTLGVEQVHDLLDVLVDFVPKIDDDETGERVDLVLRQLRRSIREARNNEASARSRREADVTWSRFLRDHPELAVTFTDEELLAALARASEQHRAKYPHTEGWVYSCVVATE